LITVCHKSSVALKSYVDSFLKFHNTSTLENSYEFIFVENSGEGEIIRKVIAPLQVGGFTVNLVESENRGFGAGCNLGSDYATGEMLLFVNPDVVFASSLQALLHQPAGQVWGTCRQFMSSSRIQSFDFFPENKGIIYETLKLYWVINWTYPLFREKMYAVGSFLMVARQLFEAVGRFDERFFMYYEEAELCRRLQKVSRPVLARQVQVLHRCFGSHPSSEAANANRWRGFLTYCDVTQQPELVAAQLQTLHILGLFSRSARDNHLLLKSLI